MYKTNFRAGKRGKKQKGRGVSPGEHCSEKENKGGLGKKGWGGVRVSSGEGILGRAQPRGEKSLLDLVRKSGGVSPKSLFESADRRRII